jgi:hypothetical protein
MISVHSLSEKYWTENGNSPLCICVPYPCKCAHCCGDEIAVNEMGGTCSMDRHMINAHKILVRKPEEKR